MPSRPLVVVTDYLAEAGVEKEILDPVADLKLLQTNDENDVIERGTSADALLVFHDIKITPRSIDTLARCRGIVRCGVGYDNVDLTAAGKRGIVVCNVPDYGTEEVADHALMLMLAIARRLIPCHAAVKGGDWDPKFVFGSPRFRGKTLGLIGCGRIGTAMALRAKALGLRVVFFDPYKPPGYEKAIGVERCLKLDELLPQCQMVSVHTPLTSETRHILNAQTLALLPKGAYVVNTARGPCVDNRAIVDALDSGQLAYAALDVVEREPLDDERLRQHPRLVLTPHAAFYSAEGFVEMRTKAAQEIRRILTGEPVLNPVNRHLLTDAKCALPPLPPV